MDYWESFWWTVQIVLWIALALFVLVSYFFTAWVTFNLGDESTKADFHWGARVFWGIVWGIMTLFALHGFIFGLNWLVTQ